MTGPLSTCRTINELLVDYCAAELGPDERSAFERHLGGCARCLACLRGYRATIRIVHAFDRDADVVAASDDLVRAILDVCDAQV